MAILDYVFGLATVLSLALALWQMLESRSKKTVEEAKTQMQLDRIRHAKYGIVGAAETVNLLVQISKADQTSPTEMRNLGRVARGQLIMTIQALEAEEKKLMNWKYGKLFQSKSLGSEGENPKTGAGVSDDKSDEHVRS